MQLLKKLFAATPESSDKGIYLYVQCEHCRTIVQLRLEPQYELVPQDDGRYRSHKTVVDQKCYRRMAARFEFDSGRRLIESEIAGGALVDEAAYRAQRAGT